ncbi:MAG: 30S ribosome-binding factor RbfA [Desulfobacterales bacterium]|jgi:ribosome-binding factor A|nr:30S ribosome-binding factor RbfA [Desulfobacterales bacterium]
MTSASRAQRVAGRIQELLAELLRREISDPRLALTTITGVTMTRDLRIARVYIAAAGGREASEAALDGFRSAAGFIKRHLARGLGLRYMPALEFFYDESFDRGAHIDRLLKSLSETHGSDPSTN